MKGQRPIIFRRNEFCQECPFYWQHLWVVRLLTLLIRGSKYLFELYMSLWSSRGTEKQMESFIHQSPPGSSYKSLAPPTQCTLSMLHLWHCTFQLFWLDSNSDSWYYWMLNQILLSVLFNLNITLTNWNLKIVNQINRRICL